MRKLILTTIFCLFSFKSFAQQTIFNAPSADVAKKGENFLQHESQFRARDQEQFLNTTHYYTRGIGYNSEFASSIFNFSTPTANNAVLAIGFKTSYQFAKENYEKYQLKFIYGLMPLISLQGQGSGIWNYAGLSAYAPQSKTRITGGFSYSDKQLFGESVKSFFGGFEQEITTKLSFVNDWYSGSHGGGILATGFAYKLPKNFIIAGGFQLPNSTKIANKSWVFSAGLTF